jgi:ureidoacrylate peracid hydrolase
MLTTLEEKIDPRHTALIVIDVQNDYVHPEGAGGKSGQDTRPAVEMVPRLLELIEAAREAGVYVIYTRNWHGPQTDSEAWLERNQRSGKEGVLRSALKETWGAEWYGVAPREDEPVIDKFRYDAFLGTRLEFLLRARGIRTVMCTGTATNVCVESTARAAHMRDYYLVMVGDCCATYSEEVHQATLFNIRRHFGLVVDGEEIINVWNKIPQAQVVAAR